MAERQGFEPWVGCPTIVFKTIAFDRSAISPRLKPYRLKAHAVYYISSTTSTPSNASPFLRILLVASVNSSRAS